jgi:hypothetical protein
VELYDAGHEAMVGWTVPAGRSLSPADIGLIRQALVEHASSGERAVAYEALLHRLAGQDAVTA